MAFRRIAAALVATVLTGCSQVEPEFQTRDSVDGLIEPAQVAFADQMDAAFGQPRHVVAWEMLPVHFHGVRAETAAVESEDGTVDRSKVELAAEYETAPIAPGQTLTVTQGPNAGATRTVAAYDAETGVATLDAPLPEDSDGEVAALDAGAFLRHGQQVYSQHCLHCHGVSGDGNGPTAASMTPRPRDYRAGEFKFTSTQSGRKASRDDLVAVLDHGIPGTYMPSFKLLAERDKRAVVEYVRWLAMRGEVEQAFGSLLNDEWSAEYLEEFEGDPEGRDEFLAEFADYAGEYLAEDFLTEAELPADKWVAAELENAVLIPETPRTPMSAESVARGRQLYLAEKSKCASCHGESGHGNGPSTMDFLNLADGPAPERGLYDSWGQPIKPRDLTRGQFRGGRRPVDIYRRIAAGVKGTPMPALATALEPDEIWDLVNYVLAVGEDPKAGQEPGGEAAADEVAMN